MFPDGTFYAPENVPSPVALKFLPTDRRVEVTATGTLYAAGVRIDEAHPFIFDRCNGPTCWLVSVRAEALIRHLDRGRSMYVVAVGSDGAVWGGEPSLDLFRQAQHRLADVAAQHSQGRTE